jgi:hypothetical protein
MTDWTWPRNFGNVAQIGSVIVAAIAVALVSLQLQQLQHNSEALKEAEQRAAARQVYMSYSEAAIRYPEFAKPDYAKITKPLEQVRYGFFVAHMLFAYDEILKVFDDPEWKLSFEYDLQQHKRYLCQLNDPTFYSQYFEKMRTLLKQARASCGPSSGPLFKAR